MKNKIIHLLYLFFGLFPIKKNRVVFSSFDYSLYGGNPRVISDYMLENNKNYEMVWVLNNDVEAKLPSGIKRISSHSLKKIYYYATAKVWVDSHHFYNRWKRKRQFLIQTWHAAVPLKKLEGNCPDYFSPSHIRQVYHCSQMADYHLSNSDMASRILREGVWCQGPILQVGMPVNDMLVYMDKKQRDIILQKLGLDNDKKYILYAPTCRQNACDDHLNTLDYDGVAQAFQKNWGGAICNPV